jgi:predicted kinase
VRYLEVEGLDLLVIVVEHDEEQLAQRVTQQVPTTADHTQWTTQ